MLARLQCNWARSEKPTMIRRIEGLSGLELSMKFNQANPINPMNHGSDMRVRDRSDSPGPTRRGIAQNEPPII